MRTVLLSVALLALVGCGGDGEPLDDMPDVAEQFPIGASNINLIGNGWAEFEFRGVIYIMSPTGSIAESKEARRFTATPP